MRDSEDGKVEKGMDEFLKEVGERKMENEEEKNTINFN